MYLSVGPAHGGQLSPFARGLKCMCVRVRVCVCACDARDSDITFGIRHFFPISMAGRPQREERRVHVPLEKASGRPCSDGLCGGSATGLFRGGLGRASWGGVRAVRRDL